MLQAWFIVCYCNTDINDQSLPCPSNMQIALSVAWHCATIKNINHDLILMLVVADLANTKWCQNSEKWSKSRHMGTHLRVLSKSYPMNSNMAGFRWFSKILHSCALDESSLSYGRVKHVAILIYQHYFPTKCEYTQNNSFLFFLPLFFHYPHTWQMLNNLRIHH